MIELGWREWVSLPELDIPLIKAKVDTGAKTSALHTFKHQLFTHESSNWIRFWLHPSHQTDEEIMCEAPIKGYRRITNSGGTSEQRHLIETPVLIGHVQRTIEITLTNRDSMRFKMLLGRQALSDFVVYPGQDYLQGKPMPEPLRENSHLIKK